MLDVHFTTDVEIWCDDWSRIEEQFPDAFQRYVYGPTPQGNFGIPYALKILAEHGLKGVFFVEPLFSTRFGNQPLEEIVGLLKEANQDIQLHLHTEWVDESIKPILKNTKQKKQYLRNFTLAEQKILIKVSKDLLQQAGSGPISAFRAGSFGFNRDTLKALKSNGIKIDSSYNQSTNGAKSGICTGEIMTNPFECEGITEYPMTVFKDGSQRLRHTQLTACTFAEIEGLLWQALEQRKKSFVILTHNFELLNRNRSQPDYVVINRLKKLCKFLDQNRDSFKVCGFDEKLEVKKMEQKNIPTSSRWKTAGRMIEQAYRWRFV